MLYMATVQRWKLPPCFGKTGGAYRSINWDGRE